MCAFVYNFYLKIVLTVIRLCQEQGMFVKVPTYFLVSKIKSSFKFVLLNTPAQNRQYLKKKNGSANLRSDIEQKHMHKSRKGDTFV